MLRSGIKLPTVLDRQFWPVGAVREFGEVIKDLAAGKVPGGCVAGGPSMEKANYAWDLVVSHGLSLTFACVVEGISQDESGDFSLVSLLVVGRTIGRRAFVKLAVVTLGATSAVLPTSIVRKGKTCPPKREYATLRVHVPQGIVGKELWNRQGSSETCG